jgi:hypothetical protein
MFTPSQPQGGLCDYFVFFNELRGFVGSWDIVYEGEFEGQRMKESGPA